MTDRDDRDRPLTSDEMIRKARKGLQSQDPGEAVLENDAIMERLDDISVDVPVADEFPEPVPEMKVRPRRVERREPTPIPQDPVFERRTQGSPGVIIAIGFAILLIALGVAAALVSGPTP